MPTGILFYTSPWFLANDFLPVRYAMRKYASHCAPRNEELDVAFSAVDLHEWPCLCDGFYHV
ncbi:hypothetical protein GCM10028895_29630 [Pontibacter rugosus]